MTLRKTINRLIFLVLTFALIACSRTITGLTKEKVIVKNTAFKFQIPTGSKQINKYYGGHGLMFTILYTDSSLVYYTDDRHFATPNSHNYKTSGFYTPIGGITADSTISGQQLDGRYWKEIFHWNERYKTGYWTGYKNISADKVNLFEKSLMTLRR